MRTASLHHRPDTGILFSDYFHFRRTHLWIVRLQRIVRSSMYGTFQRTSFDELSIIFQTRRRVQSRYTPRSQQHPFGVRNGTREIDQIANPHVVAALRFADPGSEFLLELDRLSRGEVSGVERADMH